ncbi:MAG: hypothetical protein E6R14_08650 [Thermomicrobiales bacterium]|nr:MAG: hypothetical protein E6R14_08650 [Thermomicrobiales bacterium]
MTTDWWAKQATQLLRGACRQRGFSYVQLSRALSNSVGLEIGPAELEARIARGTFSFKFALQCLAALGFQAYTFPMPDWDKAKTKGLLAREAPRPRGRHAAAGKSKSKP